MMPPDGRRGRPGKGDLLALQTLASIRRQADSQPIGVPRPRTQAEWLANENVKLRARIRDAISPAELQVWLVGNLHGRRGLSAGELHTYIEGLRRDSHATIDQAFDRVQYELARDITRARRLRAVR